MSQHGVYNFTGKQAQEFLHLLACYGLANAIHQNGNSANQLRQRILEVMPEQQNLFLELGNAELALLEPILSDRLLVDQPINIAQLLDLDLERPEYNSIRAAVRQGACKFCGADLVLSIEQLVNRQPGHLIIVKQIALDKPTRLSDYFNLVECQAVIANQRLYRRHEPEGSPNEPILVQAEVVDSYQLPLGERWLGVDATQSSHNYPLYAYLLLADKQKCVFIGALKQASWCSAFCDDSQRQEHSSLAATNILEFPINELLNIFEKVARHNTILHRAQQVLQDLTVCGFSSLNLSHQIIKLNKIEFIKLRLVALLNLGLTDFNIILPQLGLFSDSELKVLLNWLADRVVKQNIAVITADVRITQAELVQTHVLCGSEEASQADKICIKSNSSAKRQSSDLLNRKFILSDGTNQLKVNFGMVNTYEGNEFLSFAQLSNFYKAAKEKADLPWRSLVELDCKLSFVRSGAIAAQSGIDLLLADLFHASLSAKMFDLNRADILKQLNSSSQVLPVDILQGLTIAGIRLCDLIRTNFLEMQRHFVDYYSIAEALCSMIKFGLGAFRLSDETILLSDQQYLLIKILELSSKSCDGIITRSPRSDLVAYFSSYTSYDKILIARELELLNLLAGNRYTVLKLFSRVN